MNATLPAHVAAKVQEQMSLRQLDTYEVRDVEAEHSEFAHMGGAIHSFVNGEWTATRKASVTMTEGYHILSTMNELVVYVVAAVETAQPVEVAEATYPTTGTIAAHNRIGNIISVKAGGKYYLASLPSAYLNAKFGAAVPLTWRYSEAYGHDVPYIR